MEINNCISETEESEYFTKDFLNNPLFELLPDGYDLCYTLKTDENMLDINFYLYDSTKPMNEFDFDYVIASIHFYVDKQDDDVTIGSLTTNSNLDGFDLRGGGVGTFLVLCAINFAKNHNIAKANLDDMSDGYRTQNNIYLKIGFEYEGESGPEMIGDVNIIYNNIDIFIQNKGEKLTEKLNELTEYFDDEEDYEEEYDSEDEMEYGGGSNIFYGGELIHINDCLTNADTHQFFKDEFLNNELFKLLPEGYDVCFEYYGDNAEGSMSSLQFYLYDSTKPMKGERFRYEEAIGSIYLTFEYPAQGFFSWRPWNNKAHIPELRINSDLEGYDLQGAGLGTFLILTAIAYCKSINIHEVSLYDASAGF